MAIRITPGEVNSRRVLVAGAVIAFGIGWFGILDRKLYAAPHWIEPWPAIAAEATETVRQGGVVVANNSSFFFYLTYALGPDYLGTGATFHGYLPQWVRHPRIYNLGQWIQAGQPTGASTLLVKGLIILNHRKACRRLCDGWVAAAAWWKKTSLCGMPDPRGSSALRRRFLSRNGGSR